ncbi:MAG: metallophosphoesterase [Acholeplasmatales bacterium]|nr:metallophosphoesterase [Acholeplasmatales bacterium]
MNIMHVFGLLMGIGIGLYLYFIFLRMTKIVTKKVKIYSLILMIIPAALIGFVCSDAWNKYLIIMGQYCAFSIVFDLIYLIFYKLIKKHNWIKMLHYTTIIPIMITTAVLCYGNYKMNNVVETNYSYNTPKAGNYKIALMSDFHYGTIQDVKILDDKINIMNNYNLDFVVLAGDVFEENTTKEKITEFADKISKLNTKYGIYYIYGNHDRQPYKPKTFSDQDIETALTNVGVKILKDDYVIINNEIVLFGRDDLSNHKDNPRRSVESVKNEIGDKYFIVVDHQPKDLDECAKCGVDLMLSGHTHAGQIWPLGTIRRLLGHYIYGEYKKDNTTLLITSGFTGWGYPFRTEESCEYVIIKIN